MVKQTELREAAYEWIKELNQNVIFSHDKIYRFLEENFALECSQRGDAANEPRYKNDARWAVQDAKRDNLVTPTATRGQFRRV